MYRFAWALTLAERLAERLAEGLAKGPPVFVPRLNSLFSERDVENAIIMAVRRLGYNEPTRKKARPYRRFCVGRMSWCAYPRELGSRCATPAS